MLLSAKLQIAKIAILGFFLLGHSSALAQLEYALSRNDSASVIEFKQKSDEALARKDLKTATDWLNRIAKLYWDHNQFAEAATYYEKSLTYNETLGNENGIAMIQSNLGMIYFDQGRYHESLSFFEKTLAARRARKEKYSIISSLTNLAVVNNKLEQYPASILYLEEALNLALELNNPEQMKSCYGMLAETYEKAGDTKKTMQYFNLYRDFHELVQKEKVVKVQKQLELQSLQKKLLETETRNQELELFRQRIELNEKNQEIHDADSTQRVMSSTLSKQEMLLKLAEQDKFIAQMKAAESERVQRLRFWLFLAIVLIVLLVALVLFIALRRQKQFSARLAEQNMLIQNQNEKIQQSNLELETLNLDLQTLNKEISSGISYASLIQSASLYQKKRLSEYVTDSFIFFQPRDVVSGDFYWYYQIDNRLLVAAVDCTGHGVPGGFMSMIGNNLLREIVVRSRIYDPGEILRLMDEGVQSTLNQCLNNNKDGMDMALCVIDTDKRTLEYGGAKNPLLFFRDDEMILIKGSHEPIGGCVKSRIKEFETHRLELGDDNRVYIYSDGFQDQFGGPKDRKYGNKSFREYLATIHKLPMNEQHGVLFEQFEDWKEERKQIDDVLVIGLHF